MRSYCRPGNLPLYATSVDPSAEISNGHIHYVPEHMSQIPECAVEVMRVCLRCEPGNGPKEARMRALVWLVLRSYLHCSLPECQQEAVANTSLSIS